MSIVGRANHMLKLKGTVVYPQQIEEILMQEPEIKNHTLEAYKDETGCDALKIMVSLHNRSNSVLERIRRNLKARIRITPAVEVLDSQEITKIVYRHGRRKPQNFQDLRPESLTNRQY